MAKFKLNPEAWYAVIEDLKIDRMSLFVVVGLIELALRHPNIPTTTRKVGTYVGRFMLQRLIDSGIKLPPKEWAIYTRTFF